MYLELYVYDNFVFGLIFFKIVLVIWGKLPAAVVYSTKTSSVPLDIKV